MLGQITREGGAPRRPGQRIEDEPGGGLSGHKAWDPPEPWPGAAQLSDAEYLAALKARVSAARSDDDKEAVYRGAMSYAGRFRVDATRDLSEDVAVERKAERDRRPRERRVVR